MGCQNSPCGMQLYKQNDSFDLFKGKGWLCYIESIYGQFKILLPQKNHLLQKGLSHVFLLSRWNGGAKNWDLCSWLLALYNPSLRRIQQPIFSRLFHKYPIKIWNGPSSFPHTHTYQPHYIYGQKVNWKSTHKKGGNYTSNNPWTVLPI